MTALSLPRTDPIQVTTRSLAVSFPPERHRVEQMRRLTAAHLRDVGVKPDKVEDVRLIVSELATNAIQHGGPGDVEFLLTWASTGTVRVEVKDGAVGGTPRVLSPGPEEEGGRGMLLVDLLAKNWGRTGSTTWCVVEVAG